MRRSAGIVLCRRVEGRIEVLLGHMGGPFWARKDAGAWTIPKGEHGTDEDPLVAARREFEEETGLLCRLGAELATVRYRTDRGEDKTVRWWSMTAATTWPGATSRWRATTRSP